MGCSSVEIQARYLPQAMNASRRGVHKKLPARHARGHTRDFSSAFSLHSAAPLINGREYVGRKTRDASCRGGRREGGEGADGSSTHLDISPRLTFVQLFLSLPPHLPAHLIVEPVGREFHSR